MSRPLFRLCAAVVLIAISSVRADEFTYLTEEGKSITIEGMLRASGSGYHLIALPDGQMKLIKQEQLRRRVVKAPPGKSEFEATVAQLEERFGKERFRYVAEKPYIVGVVLTAPLPARSENKTKTLLDQSVGYMKQIGVLFERFADDVDFPITEPEHPLVVLIFETNKEFESYINEGGKSSLSAENVAGFYSSETNWLAVRMSECRTFETPLHEAIHQQCYNRGMLQRFAPVPRWFSEGIASGFEGNGEKVKVRPTQISQLYGNKVARSKGLPWDVLTTKDAAFLVDIFAGEAYAQGWGLHWMLVTKHRDGYGRYLKTMSRLEPLEESSDASRQEAFESAFGATPGQMQLGFQSFLQSELRRQRVKLIQRGPQIGHGVVSKDSAHVSIGLQPARSAVRVRGTVRNVNPLRPMTFYVVAMTNTGMYADWLVEDLKSNQRVRLNERTAGKPAYGVRPSYGGAKSVAVIVYSAVAGSEEARNWEAGELPIPGKERFEQMMKAMKEQHETGREMPGGRSSSNPGFE